MKQAIGFGLGLAIVLAIPALADQTVATVKPVHRLRVYHHVYNAPESAGISRGATAQVILLPVDVVPSFLPSFLPHIAPYPDGVGDEDGLSREVEDCNKGCISEP